MVVNKPVTFEEATAKEKKIAENFVNEQKELSGTMEDVNSKE